MLGAIYHAQTWIRWVMASTHETPERGGAPALGSLRPSNMEVQHARVPLGPAPESDQTAISNRNPKGLFAGKWLRALDLNLGRISLVPEASCPAVEVS